MRNFFKVLTVSMLLVPVLFSQEKQAQDKPSQDKAFQDKPEAAADVRFSADMLDKNVDPCNDFYAYACSKWLARNPIPADRSSWGRFNELAQRGEYIVRDILEKAEVDRPGRTANEQKIGDYYASCMDDEKSVELRKKYVAHVAKMFVLLGDDEGKAASEAKAVMEIETGLAKAA